VTIFNRFFVVLMLALSLSACSPSTEDIAREVRANIEEYFSEDSGVEVREFNLVHKGGNEYRGILKTKEPAGEFTYSVEVIYDGNMFSWKVID